ncbi:MAG: glycosyltransferase family 2 protein [Bdellovibrionota bacterium]
MKKLSVVIPAYNEEAFIGTLIQLIKNVPTEQLGFEKEIIVVDDGSKDKTFEIASSCEGVRVFKQVPNQGKGRAVLRGVAESTGDLILVQDADLEYDPTDYLEMLRAWDPNRPTSVYGSRTLGQRRGGRGFWAALGRHPEQSFGPWLAGVALSIWTFMLYGRWISDTLTAYKLYPAGDYKRCDIKTYGFETDHELTAKLIRQGVKIVEVPISYKPRSVEEGKKIKATDGLIALWTLLRFRFQ